MTETSEPVVYWNQPWRENRDKEKLPEEKVRELPQEVDKSYIGHPSERVDDGESEQVACKAWEAQECRRSIEI